MDASFSGVGVSGILVPIRPLEGRFVGMYFSLPFRAFLEGTRPQECQKRIPREKLHYGGLRIVWG